MQLIEEIINSSTATGFFSWIEKNGLTLVIVLVLSWFLYHLTHFVVEKLVRRTVRKTGSNHQSEDDIIKRQNTLAGLLSTVFRILVIMVSVVIIIKLIYPGFNLAPIFASAGIVGVAIGFGAQSLIKDFLSGVFIISENQYRVGDVVDIEGAAGTVERVGIRSTVLRDFDGNVHYMPNGNITHVINKTMGFSRVNFTLAVEPTTDVDLLAKVIDETGAAMAKDKKWEGKILETPKFLNISGFSQVGMEVVIVGKTEPSEQWSVTGELRRRLLIAFRKNKIQLATPLTALSLSKKK